MKKMYIGYDLGDGETIANALVYDTDDTAVLGIGSIFDTNMPTTQSSGKAIPTLFAQEASTNKILLAQDIVGASPDMIKNIAVNFKLRPSTLLGSVSEQQRQKITDAFGSPDTDWPSISEAQGKDLLVFRDKVVIFTDAIFTSPTFTDKIATILTGVEAVEFCVGHPTNWDLLDVAIYRKILQQSVLGKAVWKVGAQSLPAQLIMDAESRAAFLYTRLAFNSKGWDSDGFRLLIDIGSSTIDVTAVSGRSAQSAFNDGDTNLGARLIDYLILEWYLSELDKMNQMVSYHDAVKNNPTADKLLLFACREAKEKLFSTANPSTFIMCMGFPPVGLKRTDFDKLLDKPVRPVMEKYLKVTQDYLSSIGNKSWKQAFEAFIKGKKEILDSNDYRVTQVILTGSASQMPFVQDICKDIFGRNAIVNLDIDPSKSISKGLTLVGQSNERSKAFQADINEFITNKLSAVIDDNIPDLADKLADIIADVICDDIIKPELSNWKKGNTRTLNGAMDNIKSKCGEASIMGKLQANVKYNKALEAWTKDKLVKSIDQQLEILAKRYNVRLSADRISILAPAATINVPEGMTGQLSKVMLTPANMLAGLLAVVAGIITFFVLPTVLTFVLAIIIVVISYISVTIASIIFTVLAAIPGAGWAILAAIGGVAVIALISQGWDNIKGWLSDKIAAYNLPQWVRNRIKSEKLTASVDEQKGKIREEIRKGVMSDKARNQIIEQLKKELGRRVEEKAKEICYIIENV